MSRVSPKAMRHSLDVIACRPCERNTLKGFASVQVRELRRLTAHDVTLREKSGQRWARRHNTQPPSKPMVQDGQLIYGSDGRGDKDAGILYIKASERLAKGMNSPLAHAVQVIHQTAPVKQLTTTEETRAVLDNILHISLRERELLDRCELDGDESAGRIERTWRSRRPATVLSELD